jgi:hypothetical protein
MPPSRRRRAKPLGLIGEIIEFLPRGDRHSEVRILPPQPASPVSMEHLRFERKAVTVAGLSVSAIGLRSAKIFHLLALERIFAPVSVREFLISDF